MIKFILVILTSLAMGSVAMAASPVGENVASVSCPAIADQHTPSDPVVHVSNPNDGNGAGAANQ